MGLYQILVNTQNIQPRLTLICGDITWAIYLVDSARYKMSSNLCYVLRLWTAILNACTG